MNIHELLKWIHLNQDCKSKLNGMRHQDQSAFQLLLSRFQWCCFKDVILWGHCPRGIKPRQFEKDVGMRPLTLSYGHPGSCLHAYTVSFWANFISSFRHGVVECGGDTWRHGPVAFEKCAVGSKHIKNATWPEGCGQRNEKTRKREDQKTRKRERFWPFSRFRVSRCSHLRASLIASLIDCNMLLDANTAFLLSPFSGLRVFAVFGFSPISRFRVFAVFAVFVFTGWFLPFSRFCAFTCSVLAFSCYGMHCFGTYLTHAQSFDNVRVHSATQWTASVHILHMPKGVKTFVFKVLQKVLLRYITYTCPKLW